MSSSARHFPVMALLGLLATPVARAPAQTPVDQNDPILRSLKTLKFLPHPEFPGDITFQTDNFEWPRTGTGVQIYVGGLINYLSVKNGNAINNCTLTNGLGYTSQLFNVLGHVDQSTASVKMSDEAITTLGGLTASITEDAKSRKISPRTMALIKRELNLTSNCDLGSASAQVNSSRDYAAIGSRAPVTAVISGIPL